ncbi:unnamed protein product [Closterium sp. Yama58-4]|nr:unnamed protein product [Closterium sp. Yama58-4]
MDAQWRDDAAVAASAKSARSGCSATEGAIVKKGGGGKKGGGDKKDGASAISGGNGAKGSHGKQHRRRGSSAAVGKCSAAGGYRSDDSNASADVGGCFLFLRNPRAKTSTSARKTSAACSATGVRPGSATGVRPGSASGVRPGSASGVRPGSASGVRPPVRGASADHFRFRRSQSTSYLDERRGTGDTEGISGGTENKGDGGREEGRGRREEGGGVGGELSSFEGAGGEAATAPAASRHKRESSPSWRESSSPANTSSASPHLAAVASSPRYPPHSPHAPHAPHSPRPPVIAVSSPRLARFLSISSPRHRALRVGAPAPPPSHDRRAARRAASVSERDLKALDALEGLEASVSNRRTERAAMSTGNRRTARRAASVTERDFATFENLGNVEDFEGFEADFEALEATGSSSGYGYTSSNGYITSNSTVPSAKGFKNFEAPRSSRAVRRAWSVIERDSATSTIERGASGAWRDSLAAANRDEYNANDDDDGVVTAWPVQQHWRRECAAARGVSTEEQSGGELLGGRKSPTCKIVPGSSFVSSTTPTNQQNQPSTSPNFTRRPPPLTIHPDLPDSATSSSQSPASLCHSPTFPCPTLPISSPKPPSVSPSKPPRFPTRSPKLSPSSSIRTFPSSSLRASHSVDIPGGEGGAQQWAKMHQNTHHFARSQSNDCIPLEGTQAGSPDGLLFPLEGTQSAAQVRRPGGVDRRRPLVSPLKSPVRSGVLLVEGSESAETESSFPPKSPVKSCLLLADASGSGGGLGGSGRLKKQVSFNKVVRIRRFQSCEAFPDFGLG